MMMAGGPNVMMINTINMTRFTKKVDPIDLEFSMKLNFRFFSRYKNP